MKFYKIQGGGNDFIFPIDLINLDRNEIAKLCTRGVSVGADGIIFVKEKSGFDFEMIYYNKDGSLAEFCGNGARCSVRYAIERGIVGKNSSIHFLAGDGEHYAYKVGNDIALQMNFNGVIEKLAIEGIDGYYLNTGVPHFVILCETDCFDITLAKKIRYNAYFPRGTNVNFVWKENNRYKIRTYERGVEDETLACGTGITASGIILNKEKKGKVFIESKYGYIFEVDTNDNITLTGSTEVVYTGETVNTI
ncbi:MAG: diaminopimelate epimerase [Candidatus Delongbacteria bacterium]|nr:diaminopimelate epimerase [Candidatus Delongbacteria bacterium]MBN2833392.1 diaminopimelate epimerase [Candidatus Delongbacteria bacterium]